jgi:multiple sugar transport system substrate-binding protein
MDIKRIDRILLVAALAALAAALIFKLSMAVLRPVTTLVFSQWWRDEMEKDALESLIREFEALNPGVRVRLDTVTYETMRERLAAMAAPAPEGAAPEWQPDVIGLEQRWLWDLIQQGVLEPLDAYLEEPEFGSVIPQDQREALPLVSFINLLFYNIDLLQGGNFYRPPKTRSEFTSYAQALTEPRAGRFGLTMALGEEDSRGIYRDIFSWIWSSGGAVTGEAASPPAETLEFLNRLYQQGYCSPGIFSKTEEEKRGEFADGRIAMMIGSVADIEDIRKRNPRNNFGVTVIPVPDRYIGPPVFGIAGWYAAIPKQSGHKDEAWKLLAFLARRASFLTAAAHGVPLGGALDAAEDDPLYSKVSDIYEAGTAARELLEISRLGEAEAALRNELYALFEKGQTPEETARRLLQILEAKGE